MNTFTEIWNWWYSMGPRLDQQVFNFIPNGLITMWVLFGIAWLTFIGSVAYLEEIEDVDDLACLCLALPIFAFIVSTAVWVAMPVVLPLTIVAGFCYGLSTLGKYNRKKKEMTEEIEDEKF
jgi:hypothetical protein